MKLTVSIVSYNTRDLLDGCLRSVAEQTTVPHETFVVDNASHDGSAEMIRERHPGVTLIANGENVGFARANNQALAQARGRYFLLLNPDTVVLDHALDKLVGFMEARPRAAACGPRLIYPDGSLQRSVRRFPTLAGEFFHLSHLDKLFPRAPIIGEYRFGDFAYDRVALVDQPMGACLMMRMETIREIGPLDERFFMYFEDVDWCLRASRAGWEIYFTPEAEVIHLENAASRSVWSRTETYFLESMLRYFRKHRGPRAAVAVKGAILGTAGLRLLGWGAMGASGRLSPAEVRERCATYLRLLRRLPTM